MDTAKKKSDTCDNENELSTNPEPFKEPDGMVTIELDRNSPSPVPLSSSVFVKKEKTNGLKCFTYLPLIALLCSFSFVAAVVIHWDDIGWITKELTASKENKTFHSIPSAEPLHISQTTISIPMETCPVEPEEEYRIHLMMCERTRTFADCCHPHIRSRLPQINDVCSVLEMLDLFVGYEKIYLIRNERDTDIEYKKEDYAKEIEKKEQEKMKTKEKILSYIRHLNKPLQREIPALFDWFGELFSEYQDEFENKDQKEHSRTQKPLRKDEDNHAIYNPPPEQEIYVEHQAPSFIKNRTSETIRNSSSTKSIQENTTVRIGGQDNNWNRNGQRTSPTEEENSKKTEKTKTETTTEDSLPTPELKDQSDADKLVTSENEFTSPSPSTIFPDQTVPPIILKEMEEVKRKKRDEMREPFDSEDRPYPPYENYENNRFEVDPLYEANRNMDTNQEGMQPNVLYPVENNENQAYNNLVDEYPLVGLAPEMRKDENDQNNGYQSLINDEQRDDELRLPVHTEERDFGRQSWKDINIYGFNQGFTLPQDTPRVDVQEFMMKNDHVTYSYLEPLPEVSRTTTEGYQEQEPDIYENPINIQENRSEMKDRKSVKNDRRINDRKMRWPTDTTPIRILTSTPVVVMRDAVDATDSIESIENIRANNESVLVEIGKTEIVVSNTDRKPEQSDEELKTVDQNTDSVTENMNTELVQNETTQVRDDNMNSGNGENYRSAAQQTKGNGFQLVNEESQSSQFVNSGMCQYPQALGSPNRFILGTDSHPQMLSMVPSMNVPKSPVYVINPSVYSYIPPSPVIPHYGPIPQQYNPYAFINPLSTAPMSSMAAAPGQMANSNGQIFLCNPAVQQGNVPTTNTQAVEIRSSSNLQESFERTPMEIRTSNKSRASLNCPINEQSCLDGSKCISVRHVCDNEIHCEDGSDETFCSCRERLAEIRLCDGYFDCPDGEDERGCFGCSEDEINCDDWSRFRKGTCIPMSQRCDGIRQCEITGRDEDDCSILTDHIGETNPMKISNAAGFLHRNYKGKWYPTCFGSEVWALEVCKVEAGPSTIAPMSHLIPATEKYEGEYINLLPNREVSFVGTCVKDRASFVECPPLFCGLRMTIKNPYRPQEVDTSIEDMMNHLNRQDYTFGEDFDLSRMVKESQSRARRSEDFIVGGERVVGGKASQPAAWPWVVSIYKNGIFHCGGVIINELWVLTAAHCVDKYWLFYYEIQAGILRRFSYSPMEQIRWVVAAIAHEEYDKTNLKNDIALMRLSSAVRYNRYVRPICLPSETTAGTDFRRGPTPGTICTTVGWGATVEHGTDPDHMREVEVPVLKNCKHPEDIEGQEICAGLFEGGKDACQGDSGGPFMCQNPNNPSQWYLAGIVSHGEGCARPNEPGVYTKVSQYLDWIADNMREGNFMSRMPLQKCPGYICKGTNKCIPKKRHCDKVVDCLMGDDEMSCENTFHNIFKFSGNSFMPFFRTTNSLETKKPSETSDADEDILGAVIIDSDYGNSTVPPKLQTVKPEEEKNISHVIYHYDKKIYYNNNTNSPDYFRCDNLLQMVPIQKRCNKIVDCEDGTDELGCSCVDHLKISHPNAICDGVVDCRDSTDESVCFACREEEFNCKKSRMCISQHLVCDGKLDCSHAEDESDCVALTDGKTLLMDNSNRPNMSVAGIVSVNRFGVWRTYCNTSQSKSDATVSTNICNYLGFGEYTSFKNVKIDDHPLLIKHIDQLKINEDQGFGNGSKTCDGLYLWCSHVSSDNSLAMTYHKKNDTNETHEAPWNAAIFSDGIYQCMGLILNEKWVLTSLNCFHGILQSNMKYITVVVGKGARYLDVPGPNDQISNVAESYQVKETDMAVLRLEKSIEFTRYIQPAYLNIRIDKTRKERCVAVGLRDGKPSLVFLETRTKCSKDQTCISAVPKENCLDGPWSGVITCYAGAGWYPSAVFSSMGKSCPFEEDANFTSVRYWAKDIQKYAASRKAVHQKSFCEGFRCDLGNCINVDEVCDGLPQCSNGEDEAPHICREKKNACPLLKNCDCPVDHLRCLNGKCVPKSKFCDRVDDCGDYSDEPPRCTCRAFLKLTHPKKVCDGHVNCFDGSDETPTMCQCKQDDFVCSISKFCISNEMVCNGFVDCPDGEDEKQCYALAFNTSNGAKSGEVLIKTAGQLFDSCFLASPPNSELDNICRHLGFQSSKSHRLEINLDRGNETLVPVMDTFNAVWIRREGKVPLLFRMRSGNDAYLTFRKQDNCHRLHIECI